MMIELKNHNLENGKYIVNIKKDKKKVEDDDGRSKFERLPSRLGAFFKQQEKNNESFHHFTKRKYKHYCFLHGYASNL